MKEISLSKRKKEYEYPNLLEIQLNSFEWFLQKDVPPDQRKDQGLQSVFNSIFPVESPDGKARLEFIEYYVGEPKYTEIDAKELGKTYSVPIKANLRLVIIPTGEMREQEVFFFDLPLMTERGTFIINGVERVIVNQIHRSPGVLFSVDTSSGTISGRLIPQRGSWLEFEIDVKGRIIARIDRKRKIMLGTFLKAAGLATLHLGRILKIEENPLRVTVLIDKNSAKKLPKLSKLIFKRREIQPDPDPEDAPVFYLVDYKILGDEENKTKVTLFLGKTPYEPMNSLSEVDYDFSDHRYISFIKKQKVAEEGKDVFLNVPLYDMNQVLLTIFYPVKKIPLMTETGRMQSKSSLMKNLLGSYLAAPLYTKDGKEVLLKVGEKITADIIEIIHQEKIPYIFIFDISKYHDEIALIKSIVPDDSRYPVEAVRKVMKIIRPGEVITPESAERDFRALFFIESFYDLSPVGRFKINKKFMYDPPVEKNCLIEDDVINTIDYLIKIYIQEEEPDDVDHLSNRRVRSVGELLTNYLKTSFSRMERAIKERFTLQDIKAMTPHSLISIKPVTSAINEFFATNPLSQFLDQTNPLAELTHKRRLSALGPGGLTRERAGYEVRDVHPTHYGRICPIETPEGPNIGLIVSLATMTKVNEYGFLSTPYRVVRNRKVTDEIHYLTPAEEEHYKIAQANIKVDKGRIVEDSVAARYRGKFMFIPAEEIQYMDLTPTQLISVSSSLIPFLEHNDANRALMGSNMQRQAVPLVRTEQPLVKTGTEKLAGKNSGYVIFAKRDGEVIDVDSSRIVIKPFNTSKKKDLDIYELVKFKRTNQGTCYNQKPIVRIGDKVKAGDIIADGPSICNGELSLGRNVLVAYMPWEGYNFEDAVIISERLLKDDRFTSIHIEEHEVVARDTKLGKEQITRDLPNVKEEALINLDENGIVKIGAEVKPGDILVGKVTPQGKVELTPEYKLLHAIFGEKVKDVKNTSLRLPHGSEGIVIDVKVFSREAGDDLEPGVEQLIKVYVGSKKKVQVGDKFAGRHGNKGVLAIILPEEDMPFLEDGTPIEMILNPLGVPSRMNLGQLFEAQLGWVAKQLGVQFITPPFEGATLEEIEEYMKKAGLPPFGKTILYDGRTGEPFKQPVTVGYIYMMKLIHLADDKIHARSTGPYSLVTQQPLGGKAQFGGQRFGEMEVWALEAYGAANTLQELLTVKSDDMTGRIKAYEAIIRGDNPSTPGIPESFNVLVQELRGLGLDVTVYNSRGQPIDIFRSFGPRWRRTRKRGYEDLWKK